MTKFETIFCATTWGLMNALFVGLAIGSAAPAQGVDPAYVQIASVATTRAA